jgi:murein DD-endopeptidase MepM/ murein hydrolase activator NlpD
VLPYPVGGAYTILQAYCTAAGRSHCDKIAYDITMEMGSEVVASRAGVVWIVRDVFPDDGISSPDDNNIYITHADGQTSLYAHLQSGSPVVQPGDDVVAGELIARAGSSGTWVACPSCAVLHFEVFPTPEYDPLNDVAVSFRNADGPLDGRGGLVEGAAYAALPH